MLARGASLKDVLCDKARKKKNLGCNFGYTARCGKILLNFWGHNFTINVFIRIFQAHNI